MNQKNGLNGSSDKQEVKYVADQSELSQELKPECVVRKKDTAFLYFTVIIADLIIFVSGSLVVWPSPVIPKLESNDTTINPLGQPATTGDISAITGTPILVGMVGSLIFPKLADVIGRKLLIQILTIVTFFSFLLLAFSTSVTMIVISRCTMDILLTGSTAMIPIFVTEICEDHNRAKFGCFYGLFHQIGHFYMFIIGPLFSFRTLAFFTAAPLILFLIGSLVIPESPIFKLSRGKRQQCIDNLKKLRSNKSDNDILNDVKVLDQILLDKNSKNSQNILTIFKTRETRLGLALASLPLFVQHMSGIAILMIFLGPIFNSADTIVSGDTVGIYVGMVKISCFLLTSFVVEKIGRKRMLMFSAIGTSFPLFGLGFFFYLRHINSPLLTTLYWIPFPLMLLNVCVYSFGLGPIPMAIMHEMFPSEYRASASMIIGIAVNLLVSGMVSVFPIIEATIGAHWPFFMFSLNGIIGSSLIYRFLPETKGKTLSEIQEILKNY